MYHLTGTGSQLKIQLINQHYQPPDLDAIFSYIEMPDLNKMFTKHKARFNKRTSSAVWLSPMYKPSGKPMVPEEEEEDSWKGYHTAEIFALDN